MRRSGWLGNAAFMRQRRILSCVREIELQEHFFTLIWFDVQPTKRAEQPVKVRSGMRRTFL
jgi:hypothetical protein